MANIFSSTTFGDVSQGQILEALALQDVPNFVLSYQWQTSANGLTWTNVAQADQRTFTLQQAQVGLYVRVLASVASDASHVVNNVNDLPTGAVTLVGSVAEDGRLTVQSTISDLDGLGTLRYQWQQSADGVAWTNVSDATQVSLDLKAAHVGQHLRALVSYTDGGGTVESMFSAASTVVAHTNHAPTGGVKVALASDNLKADATVTASSDVLVASNTLDDKDGMGTVAYQWQKLSKDISGTDVWVDIAQANGATLAPVGMAGQQVRVKASYTDLLGSKETQTSAAVLVNDVAAGNVGMDGNLVQGQVLTANNT
ncbi:hypothetical protein, partial [Limnohabitans sp.]|uniref:hypothetical protein n=1 Tax=Limnohabitans sp. TaxID=1907725 RepID=UPI0038B86149